MIGYKHNRNILRIYGGILGMGIFTTIIRLIKFPEYGVRPQIIIFFVSITLVSVFWESLRIVNRILDHTYPFERNITGRILIQLIIGALIGLSIRSFIYFFGEPNVPFHLDRMFLAATWVIYVLISVGVNLGFFTSYFIDRWKDSIVKTERLEKEKAQVQFDNLKNQLNPHFLFNALTSLNSLIMEDQKLASSFLQQLSKVYRYVLQHKDRNLVPLKTELEFIEHYVSLLKTRFKNGLAINFKIVETALDRSIVPVTLQLLIENAIKHNIVDKDKPLIIDIVTSGDYLVISNNLQKRKLVENSNGQGLDNLRSLYSFLSNEKVIINSTMERFYVKVPLIG